MAANAEKEVREMVVREYLGGLYYAQISETLDHLAQSTENYLGGVYGGLTVDDQEELQTKIQGEFIDMVIAECEKHRGVMAQKNPSYAKSKTEAA